MVIQIDRLPPLPQRPSDGHKGSFGTLLVVAGSTGLFGAAILVARAALRGGAGLVRCALPADLMTPLTIAVPPATTLDRDGPEFVPALREADAVVCGPGLGLHGNAGLTLDRVLAARAGKPLVLDADALNLLAPLASERSAAGAVLTPHPGEAARLLGTDVAGVQRDRQAAAMALAERAAAVVVLKGAGSVVTDGARCYVNRSGNSGLASGGTGDVLAGLLGALLAQGMGPFDAACLAVHLHGAAADLIASRLSEAGLCADDLPLAIAEVLGPR